MIGDRFVYETDSSGRVVSSSKYYYLKENSEFVEESTKTYAYNEAGNVVQVTSGSIYNDGPRVTTITYDDKSNPYYTMGFALTEDGFINFLSLSQNNPVSVQWSEERLTDHITYEYDEMSNPVKTTYYSHRMKQEYDEEGNEMGEPKEVVETYESSTVFTCQ